ncbi:hypothetical protein Tco_0640593 [Tanacetum coccineum]
MTHAAIYEMIDQRVTEPLGAYEVNRNIGPIVESDDEHESGNRGNKNEGNGNGGNRNGGNGNRGNRNGGNGKGGNRNGKGGNGSEGNNKNNWNGLVVMHVSRECTYQDFMKCQPLNFKGTEGVVGLIRWFEKMETVFHISNCPERYQVKYATCTLLNSTLTWWNSHKRNVRAEVAYAMS